MRTFILAMLCALWLAGAARSEGHIRFLPSDTKMVLTIHPETLGDAEKKNGLELIRRLYSGKLAPELSKEEKVPISDISRIVIGWPYAGTLFSVIVVRGKIDRKLMEKQLRAAAKASKSLQVEEMGKPAVPVFRRKLEDRLWTDLFPQLAAVPQLLRKALVPQEVYVAAMDDETLFVSLAGKTQMMRALRARPADTAPRTTDDLTKLLRKQDAKDLVAFALMDDSLAPVVQVVASEEAKETFEQFEHITARVRGGKEIEIVIRVTGKSKELGETLAKKSEQALKNLRGNLEKLAPDKGQRAALDALLKGFRVSRKEAVVTLTAKVPEANARKLLPVVP
jgi:hypothetical protein